MQTTARAPHLIDLSDARTQRAIVLAADAGQWLKCRATADGRKAYGIRSSSSGVYYITTRSSCTCPDAQYGNAPHCKHQLAVAIHVALSA